jgi:hypothetical protein
MPTGAVWCRAERWRIIPHMPMYVIERAFAEQLELTSDDVELIEEANADEGVRWLFSFLSADRRRSYCLYEAPSPDMIIAAAKRAGIPADAVVEVERISADMYV